MDLSGDDHLFFLMDNLQLSYTNVHLLTTQSICQKNTVESQKPLK